MLPQLPVSVLGVATWALLTAWSFMFIYLACVLRYSAPDVLDLLLHLGHVGALIPLQLLLGDMLDVF